VADTSRFAHKYSALVGREQYVGQQLQKLADTHFDGSLAPMLLALIDRVKLSHKGRDAIRKLIEGIQ
jgi:predicted transcriptional regulator